jgi:hypothetical protein
MGTLGGGSVHRKATWVTKKRPLIYTPSGIPPRDAMLELWKERPMVNLDTKTFRFLQSGPSAEAVSNFWLCPKLGFH